MRSMMFRWTIIFIEIFLSAISSYALPVFDDGKFFAPSSLFSTSDWDYTGTLPSSLNTGFKAKNIDDDFFGDSGTQYVTGNRSITTSKGTTPSYNLTFRGEFEKIDSQAWNSDLLAQSKGEKQSDDLDDMEKVEFPSPGNNITNEHPIPSSWQSLNGYANPTGSYAKFDKTFSLSRFYLDAGELGCPQEAGHCRYVESFFKGGANLEANLQGSGSIENVEIGTQSVTINEKANRITTFKINGDPVFSGEINGTASAFSLEEEKIKSVNFSFSGSFKDQTISVGADVQWDGRGNTASVDASYVKRIEMSDYINVGSASQFLVEVRDDPQLTAGIEGTDFYKAKVLASIGLSSIDAIIMPVFEPVASGRLSVKGAEIVSSNRFLKIPDGGFVNDQFFIFNIGIINDGFMDIIVNDMLISIFDEDILFDDLLDNYMKKNIDLLLSPGKFFDFSFGLYLSADALNKAIGFLEGNYLELKAIGKFNFTDTFGTRITEFDVKIVPEPRTLVLILVGMLLILTIRKGSRPARIVRK